MKCRKARCFAFCAITLVGVFALWVGYRVMGYWSDHRLLAELSAMKPSCGYDGASWGRPDLRHLPQNSLLFRPPVWRIIRPVFARVDTIVLNNVTDMARVIKNATLLLT